MSKHHDLPKPTDFRVVSTEIIFDSPYLRVRHDQIKRGDAVSDFYTALREDASFVIPFDGTHIYLIRQFRYQTMTWFYEIPAGKVNPDEDMLSAAHRELIEETGLEAAKMEPLGIFAIAPGMSDVWGHCYLATGLAMSQTTSFDKLEQIEIAQKYSIAQVKDMLVDGTINNGPTLAALGIFFAKLHP